MSIAIQVFGIYEMSTRLFKFISTSEQCYSLYSPLFVFYSVFTQDRCVHVDARCVHVNDTCNSSTRT